MQESHSLNLEGNTIRFDVVKGIVVGDKKWSETHVFSTGGKGYVGSQGGYVQLPTINSSVSTRHEIWVKENESEREFPICLTDAEVKVRAGHEVIVVIADTGRHRYFAQLINRASRQSFPLIANFQDFVLEAAKLRRVGFIGTATVALIFATIIGTAADLTYQGFQQSNEAQNLHAEADLIQVDYDKYAKSSDGERASLRSAFQEQYQTRLFGISSEQLHKARMSGEYHKLLEQKAQKKLGIAVPWHYFSNPTDSKRPKLNPVQENALYQLWYGHPKEQPRTGYDEKYRENAKQIGLLVGSSLGLLGLFFAAYRVNRFSQRLRDAEGKIQAQLKRLSGALT